ncbi:putative uncharacterized protein [Waddlia chondrophila 2032/99]|uniref:Toprim domain-containing protein n=3 Tax=Waddlia chondrophila TaxID=71667 RepID=D6YUT9_WADCW|nr:hypothetical protein [Waddlia chondrophila]ADI37900.1 conserved hypothetical protein [Waddlia chondrophila WSU 86-1044]CCB91273.1 putative uncharacterized protein [Waddlia chondrophila 2032/99]
MNLLNSSTSIAQLTQRGLTLKTIQHFHLGWNPTTLFQPRTTWGLSEEIKENGNPRKLWLPKGIVIPSFKKTIPMKIKIRRDNWTKQDPLPKYIEVSGSKPSPTIYGDTTKPIIIVESELDAILAQQEASHLVCSVALGGVSKKPDAKLDTILRQAPLILLSLDFDEAGKKHCAFWMRQYSNLRLWPCPFTKSLGDAFQTSPANLIRRPPFLKNKVLNTSLTIPLAVCRL